MSMYLTLSFLEIYSNRSTAHENVSLAFAPPFESLSLRVWSCFLSMRDNYAKYADNSELCKRVRSYLSKNN